MPDFIVNILLGVKEWVEGKLEPMSYTISSNINNLYNTKQDNLTAGTNILINNNTISATDTTYSDFAGSAHGLVPAATSGDLTKYLKGDGTWGASAGPGLEFEWDGDQLGVRVEGESQYTYSRSLTGHDGAAGQDGQNGQDGQDGADGVGLDYNWDGTLLGIKREDEESYSYTDLCGPAGNDGINYYPISWSLHDDWVDYYAEENPSLTWITSVVGSTAIKYYLNNTYDWGQHDNTLSLIWDSYRPYTIAQGTVTSQQWEDMKDSYFAYFASLVPGALPILFPWGDTAAVNGGSLDFGFNFIGSGAGTVTSVSAGVGLTTSDGNAITSRGTVKAKLNSETSLGTIGTTDKLYAVGVDSNGQLAVNVPWSDNNSASLKTFSIATATKGITTNETISSKIYFYNGTDKFTVSDGTTSFDVNISHTDPEASSYDIKDISDSTGLKPPVGSIQMYAGSTAPTGWKLCNGDRIILIYTYDSSANTWSDVPSNSALTDLYNVIQDTYSTLSSSNAGKHAIFIPNPPSGAPGYVSSYTPSGNNIIVTGSLVSDINLASWFSDSYIYYNVLFSGNSVTYQWQTYTNLPNFLQRFPLGAKANDTIGCYWNSDSWNSWSSALGERGGEKTTELYPSNLPDHKHGVTAYASSSGNGAIESEGTSGTSYSAKTDATIYNSSDTQITSSNRHNINNTPPFLAVNFIIKY